MNELENNSGPWHNQKALQEAYNAHELPSIEDLDKIVLNIKIGEWNPERDTLRARALFAIYYLTAGRVSELLPDNESDGLKKRDIYIKQSGPYKALMFHIKNRKHQKRSSKASPVSIVRERIMLQHVYNYIKTLSSDDTLFNFSVRRAEQIITSTTGFNCHFIRHIRATHLITKYNFNEFQLIRFMGWTDSRSAKHYIELKDSDIIAQFERQQ